MYKKWQQGARLLSEFDIKIGRLACSVRNKTLTQQDIDDACTDADEIIKSLGENNDHRKRPIKRRRIDRTNGL
ncbi:hypothetical protein [Dickeya fangzhongdai]|uniref:Uncharacterized protein n=1 Tax=Dickeya fangzhongdai TaxID=1778540 RepID=A0A2K8QPP6_9GAMM|nr:hypothetical protein [Dickeya fangzhongdai]ATZ95332.1 hypothetical protein CVE23_15905 [Dickeya fangzhongdai]QOH48774.1 hypothetical protein DYD82_15975 [Dickeya fangzhongdai]QOH53078.1 hypothetical protein DYD83_15975 [Dickeya fangzhongdai]GGC04626.1 hypothetical protein GCM10007171_22130 [Dickeya fangzhongdai]